MKRKKVCEWILGLDKEFPQRYVVGCQNGIRADYLLPKMKGFDKCPYCGLKIKEVGRYGK